MLTDSSRIKLILFVTFLLALFLRTYKISELMIFTGDVARDYIVARDITLKREIPLVGSPSSVPWLHQGAFFTYLLGLVLWLGDYNPLVGGYFVVFAGLISVGGIYFLGKKLFSQKAGIIAALFYAASPLVVIFDRFPYHQSLISLFTILFFLSLFSAQKNSSFFILSSFLFGLLMQLELSNLVLFPVLAALFFDFRKTVNLRTFFWSFLAFAFTWIPKIIYDIKNGFTQTLGFIAWIVHKTPPVSFFLKETELKLWILERLGRIFLYISRIIFWPNAVVSTAMLLFLLFFFVKNFKLAERKRDFGRYLTLLWILFPVLGFLIQGSPSLSYVPVLFPLPALMLGFVYSNLKKKILLKTSTFLVLLLTCFNAYFLIKNEYFMKTEKNVNQKDFYNFDQSFKINEEMAKFIVEDANRIEYNLLALGSFAYFPSSKLNLTYLAWYFGNEPSDSRQKLQYVVYDQAQNLKIRDASLVKEFPYLAIAKLEND